MRDGVLLRLIGKWLNAGVMEDGNVSYPDPGSPQGGVVSPLLSNVFLHYVLDLWFEQEVKPRLRSIDSWCQANRHLPLREQQQKLNEKLRGHYAYYGVTATAKCMTT